MTKDEALKLALEALGHFEKAGLATLKTIDAIIAIREALALSESSTKCEETSHAQPEPVIDKSAAVRIATSLGWEPKREWQGLTQKDIDIAFDDTQEGGGFWEFARAIEAKLKEKNS